MEKTRKTSVYLEEIHFNYLSLMSVVTGLTKSQLVRDMIDNDISDNQELLKKLNSLLD